MDKDRGQKVAVVTEAVKQVRGEGKSKSNAMDTVQDENEAQPHRMRITSGGSMSAYVQFGLRFLQENPKTPLVLHTLPPPPKPPRPHSSSAETVTERSGPSKNRTSQKEPSRTMDTLLPCTTTAPRLIAIVELIKREYVALLRKDLQRSVRNGNSGAGKGIWQYTESGNHLPPPITEGDAQKEGGSSHDLTRVLGGRTKPKMTHCPYLQITLSTRPLGLEEKRNVTCQYVLAKRKVRGKGKGKGGKDTGKGEAEDDAENIDTARAVTDAEQRKEGKRGTTTIAAKDIGSADGSTEGGEKKADIAGSKRKSDEEDRPGKKAKTAKRP
ncbi:hypothetical protein IAR55_001467 [Kwoniella newhampshirensis]|uniref:DNA/RNA-binding protein Alba-like domain-containing protein n=1 Tax=Kwoniella newhampshirensis TaxID=1651941 RepID=A0AAW0Z296_9TREE